MRTEHAAKMAATDADIEAMRTARNRDTVALALRHHLIEAGVKAGHAKGAAALIAQSNEMVVEDHGLGRVVLASTPYGLRSAEGLVADFLSSDDGKAFRPAPAATVSTYFGDMVRDMRRGQ